MTETRVPFNGKKKEPVGVFVRLPLSEDAASIIRDDIASQILTTDALTHTVLAIGTPVTGSELEVVCSIDEDILRDIRELDDGDEEYVTDMVFKPTPDGVDTVPLIRQSDALAKLAERDAEIAKLREYYAANEDITRVGLLGATPEMFAREKKARAALKGPEA